MASKAELQKAINKKCIWCMNTDKNVSKLIATCKSDECPLWQFRSCSIEERSTAKNKE